MTMISDKKNTAQEGALMIGLIITMVILSAATTATYYLTTGSTSTGLFKNDNLQAYYLAESAERYAATAPDKLALLTQPTFTLSSGQQFTFTSVIDNGGGSYKITAVGIVNPTPSRKTKRAVASTIVTSSGGTPQTNPNLPVDTGANTNNWNTDQRSNLVHGDLSVDTTHVPGGGTALLASGADNGLVVIPASSPIKSVLQPLWSMDNGLSYDEQVKVAVSSNIGYAAGLYFRRHPNPDGSGTNISFGASFVYLFNYNDSTLDIYGGTSCDNQHTSNCSLATQTPYLVFWKDAAAGASGFRTIVYYQLPAAMNPLPDWSTVLVRIAEKPSGSSYCSNFSAARVNEIQIYYATNAIGSGNTTATDSTRLGNPRGSVNWPPANGGTTAQNDYFTLVDWGGSGAIATATVSSSVTAINVTNGGSGYTSAPTVNISGGGGSGATATATVSGPPNRRVTAINVTNGGSGYTSAPTISFTGGGGGSGAIATATVSSSVTAINVTNGGSGYTSAPTINISGGGGSNATATATVSGGHVTAVNVTNGGSGYTSAPTITFSTSNTGAGWNSNNYQLGTTADGNTVICTTDFLTNISEYNQTSGITGITVTNRGNGYTSSPTVTISGGGGSGATATANVQGNQVRTITLNNAGSGYTSAPTVTISGGGGSGATATADFSSSTDNFPPEVAFGALGNNVQNHVWFDDFAIGTGPTGSSSGTGGQIQDVSYP